MQADDHSKLELKTIGKLRAKCVEADVIERDLQGNKEIHDFRNDGSQPTHHTTRVSRSKTETVTVTDTTHASHGFKVGAMLGGQIGYVPAVFWCFSRVLMGSPIGGMIQGEQHGEQGSSRINAHQTSTGETTESTVSIT